MKLPSPKRLGLPSKFQSWRREQEHAMLQSHECDERFVCTCLPTGCHAAGTGILMYDGSVRKVEDVTVGDLLMGPDSLPRTVMRLHWGRSEMARIVPVKGEPFVVNLDHILHLYKVREKGESKSPSPSDLPARIQCSVRDYLGKSKWFRHTHKLERTGVEFQSSDALPIEPYFLGLLLGDGSLGHGTPKITTPDAEIVKEIRAYAEKWSLRVSGYQQLNNKATDYSLAGGVNRWLPNPLKKALRDLGCAVGSADKHIPSIYLRASRRDRLEMLAGLLDTDGYLGNNVFEFVSKSHALRDDVQFLARSLGLAATFSEKIVLGESYWRVCISGDVDQVPTRVVRKQATERRQIKNVLVTGFSVELLPEDSYYGFELDGDHLYLTADFTIHHNSGKTGYYIGYVRLMPPDTRAVILTATKALQDQIVADLKTLSLVDLKGKSNYRCDAASAGGNLVLDSSSPNAFVSVEHAPCQAGVPCELATTGCRYYGAGGALDAARSAQFVVMNYAKWLTSKDTDEKTVGKFDVLILDEAHAAADQLCDALAIELSRSEVEGLLGSRWLNSYVLADWQAWANTVLPDVKMRIDELNAEMRNAQAGGSKKDRRSVEEARELRAVQAKLVSLATARGQWVVDDLWASGIARGKVGMRFDPVWPAPYAEEKLFRGIPKVLLTSATIRPKSADLLGIKPKDVKFLEYGSSFPVVRRPIYFIPAGRLSAKAKPEEFERVVKVADEIIAARLDRKGLIQTVSYQRQQDFVGASEHDRIITAPNSKSTRFEIERFKNTKPPRLLASPAIDTGVDFEYDYAEYCIILKIPFPDTRSAVMKARLQEDREYGNYIVAQTLVQMAGRGMRAADDRFETFVLDAHAGWFVWGNNKHLFPKYFLNAWRKVEGKVIPKPPAKLPAKLQFMPEGKGD